VQRRIEAFLLAATFVGAALGSSSARAGDLYLAGSMFVSSAEGSSGGSTDFGFSPSGSDSDSSPAWGGALGFELGLDEPAPSASEWAAPWKLRVELEGLGGRDYELHTRGGDGFFSDTVSWTVMQNLWLDVPMSGAVTSLFGRVPLLEPLSFYVGAGLGLAINEMKATDNVSRAKTTTYGLTWQGGAGFGYAFTDLVTFLIGYRYQDLGRVASNLKTAPDQDPIGRFRLDLAAHELTTGLRVSFYSVPIPTLEH